MLGSESNNTMSG